MHASFLHTWAYILAKIGQIREDEVYTELGGHAGHFVAHLLTLARKLALGLYLGSIWSDHRDTGIDEIRGICHSFWSIYTPGRFASRYEIGSHFLV